MKWLTTIALAAALLPALGCCHKRGCQTNTSYLAPAPAGSCCETPTAGPLVPTPQPYRPGF